MMRRLFTILSVISLLLFVAGCVLWVRSYSRQEMYFADSAIILSQRGSVSVFYNTLGHRDPPQRWDSMPMGESKVFLHYWDVWIEQRVSMLGFRAGSGRLSKDVRAVGIPYWALAATFAALPLFWTGIRFRRRRRQGNLLCPSCGYDLRATRERCPECGTKSSAS